MPEDLQPGPEAGLDEELAQEPRPLWVRVAIALLAVAVLFFLVPWVARLFVPPIDPAQSAPPGHFGERCVVCHDVSPAVRLPAE